MSLDGLDVSSWQGQINWGQIPDRYQWVAIRALRGLVVDTRFRENWEGARLRGFRYRLAYAYITGTAPRAQAHALLDLVGPLRVGEGMMQDFEDTAVTNLQARDWLEEVEGNTQRPAVEYLGGALERKLARLTVVGDRPLVWPDYRSEAAARATLPDWCDAWQFTDRGVVSGITGPVDLDRIDNPAAFDAATGAPMAWRLAVSLSTLRTEVNEFAPNRSKVSDGTIGDPAHASRFSRHNPNRYGVVTALDLTHDPVGGYDAHAHADRQRVKQIAGHGHPELEYLVSNRRIASRTQSWVWRVYSGSNPHDKHVHWAVGTGSDGKSEPPYDSTERWGVAPVVPKPPPEPLPPPPGDDMILALFQCRDADAAFLGAAVPVDAEHAVPLTVVWADGDTVADYAQWVQHRQDVNAVDARDWTLLGRLPVQDSRKIWVNTDFRQVVPAA